VKIKTTLAYSLLFKKSSIDISTSIMVYGYKFPQSCTGRHNYRSDTNQGCRYFIIKTSDSIILYRLPARLQKLPKGSVSIIQLNMKTVGGIKVLVF